MKRILVVDDEAFVCKALQRALEGDQYAVDVAADGHAALNVLRQRDYDLAIVDVIMPEMDGTELIHRLRHEFPDLPVIAISGGGNYELSGYRPDAISTRAYLAAAGKAGAVAEMAKPFELAELEAMVRTVLAEPRAPAKR